VRAIQPTILAHSPEKLQILCRNGGGNRILTAHSDDAGKTWTKLEPTELPNPNSGIDAVTLADGRHLLVYNHTTRGRSPLNVAVSSDGKAWQAALALETEPGEYSYPAVIQTSDGLVHVTYTWKRTRVRHVVLDPTRLEPKPLGD
jgi:predicted neuraminidase